jgi:sulfur carrier protein
MQLVINGESKQVDEIKTVSDLLTAYKLQNKILVVELNLNIIDRDKYEVTALADGDKVEIVHFVGGG